MKKNYSTPAITIVEIELQSIIALSDGDIIKQDVSDVSTFEGGNAGAASYRSNLWD